MANPTAALSDYIAAAQHADLPADVVHQAKRTFLNFIGCAVGGAFDDSISAAAVALAVPSPTEAAVMGRGESCDFRVAALLNGISSAVYSFDDTHAEAVVHPGGPVGCALLAF